MTTTSFPMAAPSVASAPSFLDRLREWIVTVDHKRLGILYIGFALVFLGIGGIEATLIRIQLAVADNHFVSAHTFNVLFTMHGTTMVFLVGMPILAGFANYLVPLQIGARDVAFPRLNSFGFWVTCFGGLLLNASFLTAPALFGGSGAPDVGWFGYAPLTETAYSRGNATDYWVIGLIIVGIGSIAGAVNIATTILTMRTKGMTLGRMPLYTWITLVVQCMILVAVSPLTAALILLFLDRALDAHFFDTQAGGSAVLWQHFFWVFGHPEVYVLMLPGFGFLSEIIPVFSRKVIFGYPVMVAATVAIGFISVSVWAHHMFAVGMSPAANTFFAVSTGLVAVPTGIKIFNWLGTMWGGQIQLRTPMLFAIAVLLQFLVAGITGVMLSVVPFNWQLTDTYFVVAHFHFVLVGEPPVRDLRGGLLLVSQGDRPDAERAAGEVALLAVPDRVQPHVHPAALRRHARHAAPGVHVPARARPRDLESGLDHWRRVSAGGRRVFRVEPHSLIPARGGRGQRPVGRLDPRMGHQLAAARLQLRRAAGGR